MQSHGVSQNIKMNILLLRLLSCAACILRVRAQLPTFFPTVTPNPSIASTPNPSAYPTTFPTTAKPTRISTSGTPAPSLEVTFPKESEGPIEYVNARIDQYGMYANDVINTVSVDQSNGDYILAGYTDGQFITTSFGGRDFTYARYDADGAEIIKSQFGSNTDDELKCSCVDSSNHDFYVAGFSFGNSNGLGGQDAFIRKISWQQNIWANDDLYASTSGNEEFRSVVVDEATHQVYAAGITTGLFLNVYSGYSSAPNPGYYDAFIMKYDSDGTFALADQFQIRTGPNTNTCINSLAMDTNAGTIYIVGSTTGTFPGYSNLGKRDIFIKKYSSMFPPVEDWTRQFGTAGDDEITSVAVDSGNGDIYISGFTSGVFPGQLFAGGKGGTNAFLRKYNVGGTMLWTKQIGPGGYERATCVTTSSDVWGGVFLVGRTYSLMPGSSFLPSEGRIGSDGFVIKYNRDTGEELYTQQIGTPHHDEHFLGCAVDSSTGAIVIGGTTEGDLKTNTMHLAGEGQVDSIVYYAKPTDPPPLRVEGSKDSRLDKERAALAFLAFLLLLIPISFLIYWYCCRKRVKGQKIAVKGDDADIEAASSSSFFQKKMEDEIHNAEEKQMQKIKEQEKKKNKERVEELKNDYEDSVESLEQDLKSSSEKGKSDLLRKLDTKRAELRRELLDEEGLSQEAATVKANLMIAEMEDVLNVTRHDNCIKQIESITNKVNQECDAEVAKLKKLFGGDEENYRDAVEGYKDQYNRKLALLQKELENNNKAEQARLAERLKEKNKLKSKMTEEKMKKNASFKVKTENAAGSLRSEYEASINALEDEMKTQKDRQQRDLQKRLENKRKDLVKDLMEEEGFSEEEATAKANEKLADVEDALIKSNHDEAVMQLENKIDNLGDDCDRELQKLKKLGLKEDDYNNAAQQYKDLNNRKLAILENELSNAKSREQNRLAKRLEEKKKIKANTSTKRRDTVGVLKSEYESSVRSLEDEMKTQKEKQQRDLRKRLENKRKDLVKELVEEEGFSEEEATVKANEKLADVEDALIKSNHEDVVSQLEDKIENLNGELDFEMKKIKKLGLKQEDYNNAVQQCKEQNNKKLAILEEELSNTRSREQNRLAKRLQEKNKQKEAIKEVRNNLTSEYKASLKTLEDDLKIKQEKHQNDLQKRLDQRRAQVVRRLQQEEGYSAEEAEIKAAPIIEEEAAITASLATESIANEIQSDMNNLKSEQDLELKRLRSIGLSEKEYQNAVEKYKDMHNQKLEALDSALESVKAAEQKRLQSRLSEKKKQRADADKVQESEIMQIKFQMEKTLETLENSDASAESVTRAKKAHEDSLRLLEEDLKSRHEKEQRDIQKRLEKKRQDLAKRLEEEQSLSKRDAEAKALAVVKEEEKVLVSAATESLNKQIEALNKPIPIKVRTHLQGMGLMSNLDINGDGIVSEEEIQAHILMGKKQASAKQRAFDIEKEAKRVQDQKRLQDRLNKKKGGSNSRESRQISEDDSPRFGMSPSDD